MTFRIDSVKHYNDNSWHCRMKGLGGEGIYATLCTDTEGRGLYNLDDLIAQKLEPLIDPEKFTIPLDASSEEARGFFAQAFSNLNWGPEVNDFGTIIG